MEEGERHPSDRWLEAINAALDAKGVPAAARPFDAWRALTLESGVALASSDPAVRRIFAWFKERARPGTGTVGALFEGVVFHDGSFWPLVVPPVFGTVELRLEQALPGMPPAVLRELVEAPESRAFVLAVWHDTIAYGTVISELLRTEADEDTLGFLRGADRELREAALLMLGRSPDANAIQAARNAIEMIAKWFLRRKEAASMERLKKTGHNLVRLLEEAAKHLPPGALDTELAAVMKIPDVGARYSPQRPDLSGLWHAYRTALRTCAMLVHAGTDASDQQQP